MKGPDLIFSYFPTLTETQQQQFTQLFDLYEEWNAKINVISRKDMEHFYTHHVLHSLAIAKEVKFQSGTEIIDLGTGGGFPGIPLAIMFPQCKFLLIDGITKKIRVVQEVVDALGLKNVEAVQGRAEELKHRKFDFVVTRAVASMDKLQVWTQRLIKTQGKNAIPNGILALKGGNLKEEAKTLQSGTYHDTYSLTEYFRDEWFKEKYLVYIQG